MGWDLDIIIEVKEMCNWKYVMSLPDDFGSRNHLLMHWLCGKESFSRHKWEIKDFKTISINNGFPIDVDRKTQRLIDVCDNPVSITYYYLKTILLELEKLKLNDFYEEIKPFFIEFNEFIKDLDFLFNAENVRLICYYD